MTVRSLSLMLALGLVAGCAQPVVAPRATASSVCAAGAFPIAGFCMPDEDAKAYCGKGARPEGGGCLPISCAEGEPIDLASGECLPVLSFKRLLAERAEHDDAGAAARRGAGGGGGGGAKEEEADGGGNSAEARSERDAGAGCLSPEAGLIVEGTSIGCLSRAFECGRGARWRGGACHADPVCPLGSIVDAQGGCVTVLQKVRGEAVLDVGAWIRVMVGPDGGDGSAAICGPLEERPWRAGVIPHGNAKVEVQVDFVFPDNDVKGAKVTVSAKKRIDPHVMETATLVPAARYLDPVWNALRSLGGVANASSASVRVHCQLDGGNDLAGARHPFAPDPQAAGGRRGKR